MPWFLPSLLLSLLVPLVLPGAAVAASGNSAATGPRWRMPVAGAEVAGRFAYDRERPFRAGQRRGIDLVARPGVPVRSACAGRVTHAGSVPWGGRGVTVRCGALVATHLGLGSLAVRRGTPVVAGQRLGTVRAAGRVRLGARVAAERWGWIDPLGLLDVRREPPPLVPAVRTPRAPHAPRPVRAPRPGPAVRPVRTGPVPTSGPVPLTVLAWSGVGLLAIGLGVHRGLWRSGPGRVLRGVVRDAAAGR